MPAGYRKEPLEETCGQCLNIFISFKTAEKYCSGVCRKKVRAAQQKQWVVNHPEYTPPSYARGYQRYRKRNREYDKLWIKNRPDVRRRNNHTRRAKLKGSGGVLPPDVESILFDEQDGCCYLCGELLYGRFDDPINIEHKIPIMRGGLNVISNVALSHQSCNNKKHTKTHEEFLKTKET